MCSPLHVRYGRLRVPSSTYNARVSRGAISTREYSSESRALAAIERLKRSTLSRTRAAQATNDRSPVLDKSRRRSKSQGTSMSVLSQHCSHRPISDAAGKRPDCEAAHPDWRRTLDEPGFGSPRSRHVLGLCRPLLKARCSTRSRDNHSEVQTDGSERRPHPPSGQKLFKGAKRRRRVRRTARLPPTPRCLVGGSRDRVRHNNHLGILELSTRKACGLASHRTFTDCSLVDPILRMTCWHSQL